MAYLKKKEITLHYQDIGSGSKIIVFNHGLIMDNLSSWYFTLGNRLAQSARVILYDMRGHGKSSRPPLGYTVSDFVNDLHFVIKSLARNNPVYLVGNSFGGLLNIAYTIQYPHHVKGIILVDALHGDQNFALDMVSTLKLKPPERDRMIAKSFKHWLGRNSQRKKNRLIRNASYLVYETSLIKDIEQITPITDEQLANLRVPVLALYGEYSNVRGQAEYLRQFIPNYELRLFPGCTHSIIWEATEELCDQTLTWINMN